LTEEWREGRKLVAWGKTTIGNITMDLSYGTSKKCDYSVKNGIPFLRIPNISSGEINLSDLKYACLDKKERNHYTLEKGDLLMIRSNGSVSLLGLSVVVDESVVGYAYAGYLIRLKCIKDIIIPDYLSFVLSSDGLRTQIELPARSTTGVHNINSGEIKVLRIPLPPLQEQKEIVNRIEKLFAFADSLEARYNKTMEQVAKIEQAVLAKAFRGELVEPGPNDESAEGLLKRIRYKKKERAVR
jgi:type I restriction enzyme S subunit